MGNTKLRLGSIKIFNQTDINGANYEMAYVKLFIKQAFLKSPWGQLIGFFLLVRHPATRRRMLKAFIMLLDFICACSWSKMPALRVFSVDNFGILRIGDLWIGRSIANLKLSVF